jgi:hypothetical protein
MLWGIQNQLRFFCAGYLGQLVPQHDVYTVLLLFLRNKKKVGRKSSVEKVLPYQTFLREGIPTQWPKPVCQLLDFPFLCTSAHTVDWKPCQSC